MSALLKFEQTAYWQECCNCGITFGMLKSWDERLRQKRTSFYCPNGHSQSYLGQSDAQKLKEKEEQLAEEKRLRLLAENQLRWKDNEVRAAKAKVTKTTNKLKKFQTRVDAGVCPHCNRTFKQLAAHMKCKHATIIEHE